MNQNFWKYRDHYVLFGPVEGVLEKIWIKNVIPWSLLLTNATKFWVLFK